MNIRTDWKLARRDLLKQLGVGVGVLPLLHATRSFAAAPAAKKLFIIAASEGYRQTDWAPKATGALTAANLGKTCASLAPYVSDLIFLPDMHLPTEGTCDTCGHGAYGVVYYGLPNISVGGEYKEPAGPTVDQIVAGGLPKNPNGYPTLALNIQIDIPPHNGGPGYNHCFWKGAGQPINSEGDPFKTFNALFGGATPPAGGTDTAAIKRQFAQRKSILDYVGNSLDRFKKRLGTDDQLLMDGHMAAIRDLEQQLQLEVNNSTGGGGGTCGPGPIGPMINLADPIQYPNVLKPQTSLALAALSCGITQVVTLQLGDATGDNINFGFIPGMSKGTGYKTSYRNWHDLAHNPMGGGKDEKQIVDQWFMDQFALIIKTMKATPDAAGGSLLDNSVILWGNDMGDGQSHTSQHIPFILAGSCGQYFKTGQVANSAGQPLTGVLAEICNAMGIPTHPFGAAIPGIKA